MMTCTRAVLSLRNHTKRKAPSSSAMTFARRNHGMLPGQAVRHQHCLSC